MLGSLALETGESIYWVLSCVFKSDWFDYLNFVVNYVLPL